MEKHSSMSYHFLGIILKGLLYPAMRAGEILFPAEKQRLMEMRGRSLSSFHKKNPHEMYFWIHGASLGEAGVVVKLAKQLEKEMPGLLIRFTLSAVTATGVGALKKKFGSRAEVTFSPLDLPGWPDAALLARKPDAMIFVETEIWPNWIQACSKKKIPVFMVNGRLSKKSFPRYRKIPRILKETLCRIEAFSMISEGDAERIHKLGAPSEKISICGNIKRDMLLPDSSSLIPDKKTLGLDEEAQIWICGSIRKGEEVPILEVYARLKREFPDLYLILAPRHLKRVPIVEKAVDMAGFDHKRLSEKNGKPAPVFILDTMGELLSYYSLADVVFSGGSFVPEGGQNLLEAASCARPVLFGPFMENFENEKKLLEEAGAALEVKNGEELFQEISRLLRFPEEAQAMGKKGYATLEASSGSTSCHAKVILDHLKIPGLEKLPLDSNAK